MCIEKCASKVNIKITQINLIRINRMIVYCFSSNFDLIVYRFS